MVAAAPATVFKRYVALELSRLRRAAGLKREQVAAHLQCSVGHVGHLETMVSLPRAPEVRTLLPLYHAEDRVEDFLTLVGAARRGTDWWTDFPGVPKWLDLLLGMEAAAATSNSYDATLVPGLFQTPAYAEAVMRAGEPNLADEEIQQRLQLRLIRQDVLTREPDPLIVWCLLEESVLHRRPADIEVLREQLEHLAQLSALPNVHIQVLPTSAEGLHPGMNGTFTILTFAPALVGDPGVIYIESRIRGTYYEDPSEIANYRDAWSRVQLLALSPTDSRELLTRQAKEITP